MNTVRKLLLGASTAATLAGLATAANAQANTANATASVSATIIQPITLTKNNDLSFGIIARPTSGSATIQLGTTTAAGPVTVTAGTAAVVPGGTSSRGQFTVTGDEGRTYSLTGHTGTLTLTHTNNTDTLTFNKNVVAQSGTLGTLSGTAGQFAQGTQVLLAGGTFDIDDETTTGAYSGNLVLTVTYN